ncbi:MAG TPA: PilZ domain-containing protein [Methylococcaceae bacterium]|jgi:hypothetical protein|nr:PilZ domain-containing protein [Methylococcaceae bacterium]
MIEAQEKRSFGRMNANCRMSFRRAVSGMVHEGWCINISGAGILFQANLPVEPGRAVEIHTMPNDKITPPLTAFIEVVRCTRTDAEHYWIAGAIKGIKTA